MFIKKAIKPLLNNRNFFKVVSQNEKGVKLFLGKFNNDVEPGFNINLPFFHQIWLIDMRERIMSIPEMKIVSLDNVTYKVEGSIQNY